MDVEVFLSFYYDPRGKGLCTFVINTEQMPMQIETSYHVGVRSGALCNRP